MAGRPIGKLHQEDVRKKIQVSQLLNVLQDHALSEGTEISMSRMKAIEILLRKSLPDLTAMTLSAPDGGPLQVDASIDATRLSIDQLKALASIKVSDE